MAVEMQGAEFMENAPQNHRSLLAFTMFDQGTGLVVLPLQTLNRIAFTLRECLCDRDRPHPSSTVA
jgi:hypothetical protein